MIRSALTVEKRVSGHVSVYDLISKDKLFELSERQKDNLICEMEGLFEINFSQKQDKRKIKMLFEFMVSEGWTYERMIDSLRNFFINCRNYFDKWVIADVMSYDKKCFTSEAMRILCEKEGLNKNSFTRFISPEGIIYYWDNRNGKCPFPEAKIRTEKYAYYEDEIGEIHFVDENSNNPRLKKWKKMI